MVIYFELKIFISILIIFILKLNIASLSSMWENQICVIGSQKISYKYSTFFPQSSEFSHPSELNSRGKRIICSPLLCLNLIQRNISWLVLGIFSVDCIFDFLNEVFWEIGCFFDVCPFLMYVHLINTKGICN